MAWCAWAVSRGHRLTFTRCAAGLATGLATLSLIGGIALLQNGDLVLLRGYGRPEDAGLYAACASLGNLFVTVTAPLYVPAFPRALTAYRRGQGTRAILVGVLTPIGLAGVAAVVGALVLGELVIAVLFGADFLGAASILPAYRPRPRCSWWLACSVTRRRDRSRPRGPHHDRAGPSADWVPSRSCIPIARDRAADARGK